MPSVNGRVEDGLRGEGDRHILGPLVSQLHPVAALGSGRGHVAQGRRVTGAALASGAQFGASVPDHYRAVRLSPAFDGVDQVLARSAVGFFAREGIRYQFHAVSLDRPAGRVAGKPASHADLLAGVELRCADVSEFAPGAGDEGGFPSLMQVCHDKRADV